MYYLIGTLVVLGVAVLVHELGHFLIARRNGVRVEEFCIGFPPRVWKTKKGGTQYSLGIIPVGGFVKMAGDEPDSVSGAPDEFFAKSVWVRIRIALAGPFANLICAYLCVLVYIWTGGVQIPVHDPVFGTSEAADVYQNIGLQVGDRVVEVRGGDPKTYAGIFEKLQSADTWPAVLVVERKTGRLSVQIDSEQARKLSEAANPFVIPEISKIMPGSPAERGGLKPGDRISEINGRPISEWSQLHSTVSASAGETLVLGVVRKDRILTLAVVPETQRQQKASGEVEKVGRIGIQNSVETVSPKFGFWESLKASCIMLYKFIIMFLDVLWKIFTGGISFKTLSGPVGIAQFAGESLKLGGYQFIWFLGMINANLGFMNLIPFFLITDGGLILLFCIEAVRRRKMPLKWLERWNTLGWSMVLTLLVTATWNDLVIRLELGDKLSRGLSALRNLF